jgi:hypothetical protein
MVYFYESIRKLFAVQWFAFPGDGFGVILVEAVEPPSLFRRETPTVCVVLGSFFLHAQFTAYNTTDTSVHDFVCEPLVFASASAVRTQIVTVFPA